MENIKFKVFIVIWTIIGAFGLLVDYINAYETKFILIWVVITIAISLVLRYIIKKNSQK